MSVGDNPFQGFSAPTIRGPSVLGYGSMAGPARNNRFLDLLDSDPREAERKYRALRGKLIFYFQHNGCANRHICTRRAWFQDENPGQGETSCEYQPISRCPCRLCFSGSCSFPEPRWPPLITVLLSLPRTCPSPTAASSRARTATSTRSEMSIPLCSTQTTGTPTSWLRRLTTGPTTSA